MTSRQVEPPKTVALSGAHAHKMNVLQNNKRIRRKNVMEGEKKRDCAEEWPPR